MTLTFDMRKSIRAGGAPFQLDAHGQIEKRGVFLGPSGAGKTLAMRCLAGLATPDAGTIRAGDVTFFDSVSRRNLPPQQRRVGYVPQEYALFAHLTVLGNVAYPTAHCLGLWPNSRQRAQALALLEMVGLAHLARRYPHQLSGGQRQRVALARALNARPRLLLLDEPFAALDIPLREQMRRELTALLDTLDLTVLIISHDPADAAAFGGAIIGFEEGRGAPKAPALRQS